MLYVFIIETNDAGKNQIEDTILSSMTGDDRLVSVQEIDEEILASLVDNG